ncbi:hypothetical protein MCOR25_004113 [Pyricularia grisea]|nr:hypothetical protein MCOR25_004113 [Pyricularia grisea]
MSSMIEPAWPSWLAAGAAIRGCKVAVAVRADHGGLGGLFQLRDEALVVAIAVGRAAALRDGVSQRHDAEKRAVGKGWCRRQHGRVRGGQGWTDGDEPEKEGLQIPGLPDLGYLLCSIKRESDENLKSSDIRGYGTGDNAA